MAAYVHLPTKAGGSNYDSTAMFYLALVVMDDDDDDNEQPS